MLQGIKIPAHVARAEYEKTKPAIRKALLESFAAAAVCFGVIFSPLAYKTTEIYADYAKQLVDNKERAVRAYPELESEEENRLAGDLRYARRMETGLLAWAGAMALFTGLAAQTLVYAKRRPKGLIFNRDGSHKWVTDFGSTMRM